MLYFSKKGKIMFKTFQQLPSVYQGIIYIGLGTTVILYALGIIQTGINFLVLAFAGYIVFVGCVKLGFFKNHFRSLQ